MLNALEVIIVDDSLVTPPKPKMWVCVECDLGIFFRINSKPWGIAYPIKSGAEHPWLKHDSFIELGHPLELDEYAIEESLRANRPLGCIHPKHVPDLIKIIEQDPGFSPAVVAAIKDFLTK